MLNIPPDHPARDLWDTLYVDVEDHLLRTHTSPGQIRVMTSTPPPIRALLPGRCYRYEAIDASHASEFFQVEGLMVDEGTTMGDLKGLLDQFAKAMYGHDKRTRFRPGLLPVHGAVGGVRCRVPRLRRLGLSGLLEVGLDDDPRRGHGPPGRAPVRRASTRSATRASRSGWASSGSRTSATRSATCGCTWRTTCASWAVPMRVPLRWLRDYVDIQLSTEQLAERLTLLGMEVKGVEQWGSDWRNVVVGELLTVEKHPRADRLSLTTVTLGDGSEPLEIVCGATNIAPGQRVPVALPGAVLPGDRRIERTEKMGVVSNGMLCSGDELNMTADADGILILPPETPLGRPLVELYGDTVLDVDVKPNRGDALSLVGLAREVAAVTGDPGPLSPRRTRRNRVSRSSVRRRRGPGHDALPAVRRPLGRRRVDRAVAGSRPDAPPAGRRRPISNVVDTSNYVMLELGKPIHTYDARASRPLPTAATA
jgi:tRNA-binding EMAP/Myf-like protein